MRPDLPFLITLLTTMTVKMQPRKINNTVYDMPTVDGLDRCEINTKLHYLNVEMDKLKAQQSALIAMRDQLDRHAEMQEMDNLFDEMFGGELTNSFTSSFTIMRIFFTVIIVLLGVNFGIELMNSSMVDLIKERNNQLERAIDQM